MNTGTERTEPCRWSGNWPCPEQKHRNKSTLFFIWGNEDNLSFKRTPHDPVTKYTLGQTQRGASYLEVPASWPTSPAGRDRHPWLLPGAPPQLATGGVFRSWGYWGPCTQHVLGLRDHPIVPLWNTNGPDAEGAIESWWKQYREGRSHLLNTYHTLGMPLGLHHSKPNLWLSFSF